MSTVDDLVGAYSRMVHLPWAAGLAPAQRTWMVVYPPTEERRVRRRLPDFENATNAGGKGWKLVDVTDTFAEWIDRHPYRDNYFRKPDSLSPAALKRYRDYVRDSVHSALEDGSDTDTVVAVVGIGALFPFLEVSVFADDIAPAVRGRLAIFFPGEYKNNNYRLLDARDGWNYLAIPITATEESL